MNADTSAARRALAALAPYVLGAACAARPSPATAPPAALPAVTADASAAAAPDAPPPAANARVLAADERISFGAGASLTGPSGWSVEVAERSVTLTCPERDLRMIVLEREAPSAAEAILGAWRSVDAGFSREIEHQLSPPPRDGWDEVTQVIYRTAPSESRQVLAIAYRKGTRYYVGLLDASLAGLSRRGAQATLTAQSVRTAGVEEESWVGRTAHPLDGERAAAFERFVREQVAAQRLPGVAVGVVQGGRLVFSRGFGVRALGGREPVTPRTLFMIGSNTKPLTTLLMARLVDAGRLRWNTPVRELLPTFHLADPGVTGRLEVQHTVCACTGMPRRDMEFLFEFDQATPERRLDAMGSMQPTTGFGEVFQYSNLLVAAGGYAAARAAQPTLDLRRGLEVALREQVFAPLGMRATTLSLAEAQRREHASPHARSLANEYALLPLALERGVESVGPAGAAWSNVEDMAAYVAMELRRGALADGTRYVSEAALLERRRARVRIDEHGSYGLGLIVADAHGVDYVTHGGNTFGFSSDFGLYPSLDLGYVVLTNGAAENGFVRGLERRLMELLLDVRPQAEEGLAFQRNDRQRRSDEERARVEVPVPHDWVGPWLGAFRNEDLGTVTFSERDGALWIDAGEWRVRAGRKQGAGGEHTLIVLDPPLAGLELQLVRGDSGEAVVLDYPQRPYRFARVDPRRALLQ